MLLFKVLTTVELTGTNHRYVGADTSAPNWLLAGLDCCAAWDRVKSGQRSACPWQIRQVSRLDARRVHV